MKRIERFEKLKENINVRITSISDKLSESNIRNLKKLGLAFAIVGSLSGCTATVLYLYDDRGIKFIDEKIDELPEPIQDIIDDIVGDDKNDEVIDSKEDDSIDTKEENPKEENKVDNNQVVIPSNNDNNSSNDNNSTNSNINNEDKKDEDKPVNPNPEHIHEYGSYTYNEKGGNEVAYCKTCGTATYRKCNMSDWTVKGNKEERHCKNGCGHTETRVHEHMHSLSETPTIGTIYGTADKCHTEYYTCTSSNCPSNEKINEHLVNHSFGSVYEIDVGRNTYHQYQNCTICGYKKYIGSVTRTPSQPDPAPSNPSTPDPTPSTPDPTPSQPDPAPSNPSTPDPTPSTPDPTPTDPTPSQPDPTPSTPDPTPSDPTPIMPGDSVPDPIEYTPSTPTPLMPDSVPDPFDSSSLRRMKNYILSAFNESNIYVGSNEDKQRKV